MKRYCLVRWTEEPDKDSVTVVEAKHVLGLTEIDALSLEDAIKNADTCLDFDELHTGFVFNVEWRQGKKPIEGWRVYEAELLNMSDRYSDLQHFMDQQQTSIQEEHIHEKRQPKPNKRFDEESFESIEETKKKKKTANISKALKKVPTGNFKMAAAKYQQDILKKFSKNSKTQPSSCQATAGSLNTCTIQSSESTSASELQFHPAIALTPRKKPWHSTPRYSESPPSNLSTLFDSQTRLIRPTTSSRPLNTFPRQPTTSSRSHSTSPRSPSTSSRPLSTTPSIPISINSFSSTNQLRSPKARSASEEECRRCEGLTKENLRLRKGLQDLFSKTQALLIEREILTERPISPIFNNNENKQIGSCSEVTLTPNRSIHDVEIFPGSKVYVSQLAWTTANQKGSYGAFARSLLTSLFPVEVLLSSNLRGGSTKHGNENLNMKPLNQNIVNAIIASATKNFPAIPSSFVGMKLNAKMNELRAQSKKKM